MVKRMFLLRRQREKKIEGWYCAVCWEDVVKDKRRCALCGLYVHEECVGITKEDTETEKNY